MEITNPNEVQANQDLPPQVHEAVDPNVRPYKGVGGGAPLSYVSKPPRTQVPIRMTKEEKSRIDEHIAKLRIQQGVGAIGYSLNQFILDAIEDRIAKDNATPQDMT
jgi:hypothetical protein